MIPMSRAHMSRALLSPIRMAALRATSVSSAASASSLARSARIARPITTTTARNFHSSPARLEPNPVTRPHLLPEFSLDGKVVVVSGGARGLGLVQAEALLEAGAVVHCIDRLEPPSNDPDSHFSKVQRRAREELGTTLSYHQFDVRNNEALNETMGKIADYTGRLDGLVAAAGINYEATALEYSQEECERMMSINVTGCFMTAQAAARQMVRLKRPGSIAMIASMSGTIANRGMYGGAYNASKAAVIQLARNLAAEWGPHGIRVNTISPGYIMTEMLQNLFVTHPHRKDQWASENMLGRLSLPHEFRGAAVFLLSDASSFMTVSPS